jgi:hypothetical protein
VRPVTDTNEPQDGAPAAAAGPGTPPSQAEAENPPAEVLEQEARERESRMPPAEMVAGEAPGEQETGTDTTRPVTPPTGNQAADAGP